MTPQLPTPPRLILGANADTRNAKKVAQAIKKQLPDVKPEVIRYALSELYT